LRRRKNLTFVGEAFEPGLLNLSWGIHMQDMKTHLEKLRADAAECALIRDLATDPEKRALFTRLAEHLSRLANEVEAAISARLSDEEGA
jgi:hypothetical protein